MRAPKQLPTNTKPQPVADQLASDGSGDIVDVRLVETDDLLAATTTLGNPVVAEADSVHSAGGEPPGETDLGPSWTRRRPPAGTAEQNSRRPARRSGRTGDDRQQVAVGARDDERFLVDR